MTKKSEGRPVRASKVRLALIHPPAWQQTTQRSERESEYRFGLIPLRSDSPPLTTIDPLKSSPQHWSNSKTEGRGFCIRRRWSWRGTPGVGAGIGTVLEPVDWVGRRLQSDGASKGRFGRAERQVAVHSAPARSKEGEWAIAAARCFALTAITLRTLASVLEVRGWYQWKGSTHNLPTTLCACGFVVACDSDSLVAVESTTSLLWRKCWAHWK